uniref:uncharacterized protein LOC122603291 n=1 Tax=Erigeron canadensis TaxID=72917 RepID=UPI001CB89983|nr:uncharacterized protein LOC122603291 [Erigeron canadensis]
MEVKYIMKWNVLKKGRTSITRRPRKPGAETGEYLNRLHQLFQTNKKLTNRRKRLRKSPLCEGDPSRTPALLHEDSGQRSLSRCQNTKSKTPLRKTNGLKSKRKVVLGLNDFSGIQLLAAAACSSFILDHVDDFSVLEEHAAPGVSTDGLSIQDNVILDTRDNGKEGEEEKADSSKGLRLHWDLNTIMDEWKEPWDLQVEPHSRQDCSMKLNLQGYESRFTNGAVIGEEISMVDHVPANQISGKHDGSIPVVPLDENRYGDFSGRTSELNEDLTCSRQVVGTNMITSRTSDGESSVTLSKSVVVDSLIHPVKCEDFVTSTTSVLREETVVKGELGVVCKLDVQPVSEEVMQGVCLSPKLSKSYCDSKGTSEGPLSECCGSNVTQDEPCHMAEGDSKDKLQVGYDSPFEDGELREPIENAFSVTETENPLSAKVRVSPELGQNVENQNFLFAQNAIPKSDIREDPLPDTFERPHINESGKVFCERKDGHDESRPPGGNLSHNDESRSFDVCRTTERQSRCGNTGDSNYRSRWDLRNEKSMGRGSGFFQDCSRNDMSVDYSTRVWGLKSSHEYERPKNDTRNYDSRGGYRSQHRRSSPSERNNGYGSNRGQPARSFSRDRYRDGSGFHTQGYHDSKPRYVDRKQRFSSNFSKPGTRSRSRSRSGSPIAWHFQKRKNLDASNSGEIEATTKGHVSPEFPFKCSDERRFRDVQYRDRRKSPGSMTRRNQRLESLGYPERLKVDDQSWSAQRPARFSQMTDQKYKDNNDDFRKHDGCYEKVTQVAHPDNDDGVRQFRYVADHHNFNSFSKDTGKEDTMVVPESKKLGERP